MQVVKRLCLQILVFIQWIVNIVCYICQKREIKKHIPQITNKLLNVSATNLAEKIRKLEVSSEELVLAYIKRIQEVNPIINAVVDNRFEEALAEAKKVDEYLKRTNISNIDLAKTKPLLGIPITVKECLAVKGMSYTAGTLTRKEIKAKKDAYVIELLKEAGAIVLLVSSTPEYCIAIETQNNIVGRTKNPYDTRRTCGGSSGGEGALLGAGASIIGIGSDIAGSIRVPCAFNGIYGHKPTTGIVSLDGSIPWCDDKRFSEYLVLGPMARYVEDLKLTLKVIAGNNAKRLNLNKEVDLQNINLYYMEDSYQEFCLLKVDKAIKSAIKAAVAYLSKTFKCQVNETKFSEMGLSAEMTGLIFRLKNHPNVFTDSEIKYSMIKEFFKFLVGKSIFTFNSFVFGSLASQRFLISDEESKLYLKNISEFKDKFSNVLGTNGVFLYPSFPTEAFKHNGFIGAMMGARFAAICNLLGCPATCVPIGLSKNGLPLGIQVIAAPYQDNLCLEVAKELGKYFGGWQPPN